jgi:energy-coupling factor transporter ATP-binding protein EcfA2
LAFQPELIDSIRSEEVFSKSLLRDTSLSLIKGQYSRVLNGGKELTNFEFSYMREKSTSFSNIDMKFDVAVASKPSTNVHAIIGRNGVGKTTLLNDMINAVTQSQPSRGKFIDRSKWIESEIDETYFSSLVSVSFSAFDPFIPPPEQSDPAKGTCYYYIGLKVAGRNDYHRDINSLQEDCCIALATCFNESDKDRLWCQSINDLGYDENFSSANLISLRNKFLETKKETLSQADSTEFKKIISIK